MKNIKFGAVKTRSLAWALTLCMVLILVPTFTLTASAADASTLAGQINGWSGDGIGTLTAEPDPADPTGKTVNVTGSVTDAIYMLGLNIDSDVTVNWNAHLITINSAAIWFAGSGTFNMTGGSIICNGPSDGIIGEYLPPNTVTFNISSGTIASGGATAFNSVHTINITGGTVNITGGQAINAAAVNITGGSNHIISGTTYAIYTNNLTITGGSGTIVSINDDAVKAFEAITVGNNTTVMGNNGSGIYNIPTAISADSGQQTFVAEGTITPPLKDIHFSTVQSIALTGTATINNTAPKVGQTLTGSLVSGNNTGTLTYSWMVGGVEAQTGADNTYKVQPADEGKTIILEITSSVETGTRTSEATSAVTEAVPPTGIPGITGYLWAMILFLLISAGLWGTILRRRLKGNNV